MRRRRRNYNHNPEQKQKPSSNPKPSSNSKLLIDSSDLFEKIINLHELGVDGDKAAVQKAQTLLTKLCVQNPNDTLAKAYLGSITTLMGRDAIDPQERLRYAMKGCKIIDEAVAKAPNDISIRSLRAYVCLELPESFFHRTKTAIEDFSYLISLYEKDNKILAKEFYFQLLFDLGTAYKNIEQQSKAEAIWKRLLSLTSDPKYIKLVKDAGAKILDYRSVMEKDVDEVKLEIEQNQNESGDFQIALGIHKQAQEGDKKSLKNALAYFEKAFQENTQSPIIAALYADILSLTAIYTDDAQTMFKNAYQAIVIFTNALTDNPNNITVRKLRAYGIFRLPEAFFHETKTAIEDFEYLITAYEKDQSVLSQAMYFEILDDLGKAYYKINMDKEAKDIWDKLLASGGVTKYSAEQTRDVKIASYLQVLFQEDIKDILEEAIRLHDLGTKGNKQAADLAYKVLGKIYQANPDNPLTQAYYGSSQAIIGRNTLDSEKMINTSVKAIASIEQAIAKERDNLQIIILRSNVFINLLEPFFHLRQKVIRDMEFVIEAYERDNQVLDEDLYWKMLYDLSMCYSRSGDNIAAEKVWSKIISEKPDSQYSVLIQGRKESAGNEYAL